MEGLLCAKHDSKGSACIHSWRPHTDSTKSIVSPLWWRNPRKGTSPRSWTSSGGIRDLEQELSIPRTRILSSYDWNPTWLSVVEGEFLKGEWETHRNFRNSEELTSVCIARNRPAWHPQWSCFGEEIVSLQTTDCQMCPRHVKGRPGETGTDGEKCVIEANSWSWLTSQVLPNLRALGSLRWDLASKIRLPAIKEDTRH